MPFSNLLLSTSCIISFESLSFEKHFKIIHVFLRPLVQKLQRFKETKFNPLYTLHFSAQSVAKIDFQKSCDRSLLLRGIRLITSDLKRLISSNCCSTRESLRDRNESPFRSNFVMTDVHSKEAQRANVFLLWKAGTKTSDIVTSVEKTHGEHAMSLRIIQRWIESVFQSRSHEHLRREPGRPADFEAQPDHSACGRVAAGERSVDSSRVS